MVGQPGVGEVVFGQAAIEVEVHGFVMPRQHELLAQIAFLGEAGADGEVLREGVVGIDQAVEFAQPQIAEGQ